MADVEIVARVERRRKWTPEEKVALLAEVEAEGGRVSVVARRHRLSESLLYNWRSAWKTAASMRAPSAVEFVPIGVIGRTEGERPDLARVPEAALAASGHWTDPTGRIDIELPGGARVRVDAAVNEVALSRVVRVLRAAA